MTKMKFTPADNLVDDVWGKVGTPERDVMEAQLKDEVDAYFCLSIEYFCSSINV